MFKSFETVDPESDFHWNKKVKFIVHLSTYGCICIHCYIYVHMVDHAGGRRSVVNPDTKSWGPPVEVTQFWRLFLTKQDYIDEDMKQKLLDMIQVTVWLHTDELIFLWFYKNENRRQNCSSGAKT